MRDLDASHRSDSSSDATLASWPRAPLRGGARENGRVNRPPAAFSDIQTDNAVVRRLGGFARLSPIETTVLCDLSKIAQHRPVQAELCPPGRAQPLMLLAGWACCQRTLSDGRRQIIRFLLPGDAVGSLDHCERPSSGCVTALTPVIVADASNIIRTCGENGAQLPGLAAALDMMRHTDEINLRDQIVRLGRQTAYERLVHLFLEFHHRLQAIGMVEENSFPLPLTQEILADALGLSVVHTNRTLQQVRRDRLLDLRNGRVTLYQVTRMRAMSDWAMA